MKLYDPEVIGRRRLEELKLDSLSMFQIAIDVEELGARSIMKKPTLVALTQIGKAKVWQIVPYTAENKKKYWGHCYVMVGKKVWHMGGHGIPEEYAGKPLSECKADEIFRDGMGVRSRKKAKNTFSKEEAGTCGTYISVKRFKNSRLTCICKSRQYN